jgi:hypothetical protein
MDAIDFESKAKGKRMLFNKYDLLFGENGNNATQFPVKIGYQGYYFNGSSLLTTVDYFKLP